jgi:DNA gyrase subunit A
VVGRNTQGVRLIRLGEAERLTGVERVAGLEPGDETSAIEGEGNDEDPDSAASGDGTALGEGGSDEVSPL